MEKCKPSKKLQSAIALINSLYKVNTDLLCEDEMKLLYVLTKKLRKKVKKINTKKEINE